MRIGSRVICVDSSVRPEHLESRNKLFQQWVEKEKKYRVRDFVFNDDIVTGVLLEEIVNDVVYQPLLKRTQEPAFALWRFRELQDDVVREGVYEESNEYVY